MNINNININDLQKYGQENYEKELLEMIDKCQFTYTLEGITYTIKSDDINSIEYNGYGKKTLGKIIFKDLKIKIRLWLLKSDGTFRQREDVFVTFIHELAHLMEYKCGWFERHSGTHRSTFDKIHSYLIIRYREVYDNEFSDKVGDCYAKRLRQKDLIRYNNSKKTEQYRKQYNLQRKVERDAEAREVLENWESIRNGKYNTNEVYEILKTHISKILFNRLNKNKSIIDMISFSNNNTVWFYVYNERGYETLHLYKLTDDEYSKLREMVLGR